MDLKSGQSNDPANLPIIQTSVLINSGFHSQKIEQSIEHSESSTGANQDVVYVTVPEVQEDEAQLSIHDDTAVESETQQTTTMSHLMQSVMLPSRIVMSALRIPFKVALRGKRRPTWTTEMEMAVTAFRSACRNAPRDLSLLRSWLDVDIFPSLMLPNNVRMHETTLHGMRVEWVYPSSLTIDNEERFSNAKILRWSEQCPVVLYLYVE
jgi:hypothetical protein